MHLAIAILAALVQRGRTGQGQLVEVAMQEAVLNLTRVKFTPTLATGKPLGRTGNRSATGGYADLIRCAGDGSNDYVYMIMPPDNPEMFERDDGGHRPARAAEATSASAHRRRAPGTPRR